MANPIYRKTMEAARKAAATGQNPNLVAPPAGSLRDAFMREYERAKGEAAEHLADRVVALGIGKRNGSDYVIYDPHAVEYMSLSRSAFVQSWLVAGEMIDVLIERNFSFLLASLPGGKKLMTITSPLPERGEWAAQIEGDKAAQAIVGAATEALE